jgi:hypothetical protein
MLTKPETMSAPMVVPKPASRRRRIVRRPQCPAGTGMVSVVTVAPVRRARSC